MKKVISVLLSLCLALSLGLTAFADSELALIMDEVYDEEEGIITVTLTLTNAAGLVTGAFNLIFDNEMCSYIENSFTALATLSIIEGGKTITDDVTCAVGFVCSTELTAEDLDEDGNLVLCYFQFEVIGEYVANSFYAFAKEVNSEEEEDIEVTPAGNEDYAPEEDEDTDDDDDDDDEDSGVSAVVIALVLLALVAAIVVIICVLYNSRKPATDKKEKTEADTDENAEAEAVEAADTEAVAEEIADTDADTEETAEAEAAADENDDTENDTDAKTDTVSKETDAAEAIARASRIINSEASRSAPAENTTAEDTTAEDTPAEDAPSKEAPAEE